ncbi:hypothetical protein J2Z40_001686 [Cytobacillus eiseniae]|uniref:UPF0344 protein J2Z40_001686 n=1 Tax=Cytobacillus eiseniae TaxID=762947 RepID=A0ABS4RFM7_9BACI|nr:YisL family protein [Cytobacillus eiseniae]MBP2241124.1 hypothetical protein [Cytobacillus eiseniae]
MIHAHITSWLLALILFIVALGLHKSGKEKGFKIVKMILRLFYLLTIGTGIWILTSINIDMMYVIKSLVGIWVIGMFEMVLAGTAKGKKTAISWLLLIISLVIVLYLGFVYLPLSF